MIFCYSVGERGFLYMTNENECIDPILLDCPMPIITERLQLRPVSPGDGISMFEAADESMDSLKEWFDWAHLITDSTGLEKTAREFYAQFILRKEFHLLAFLNQKLVASVSLHHVDWEIKSSEIGYWVRASERGNRYASEMVAAISLYAFNFLQLKKLLIVVDEENISSIKIAERSGFKLETRALGLCSKPGDPNLRMGRCYVMYKE